MGPTGLRHLLTSTLLAACLAAASACGGTAASSGGAPSGGATSGGQTPPATSAALPSETAAPAAGLTPVVIAEPVHDIGYLPLYVAIDRGMFRQRGLDVSVISLPTSGSAHTDAVLSGRAWGFIGGPEHNAYADVKGAHLHAIVNVVNRGNVYFTARPGVKVGSNLKAFLKGKRIATSAYGGTPNSITRYMLAKLGLNPKTDVTLLEVAAPAELALMGQGRADVAVVSVTQLEQGIADGAWGQPFYSVPAKMGPYAYSTVNVKQSTITGQPKVAQAFVDGMLAGLTYVRDNHAGAAAVAAKEFPDISPSVLKATLARAYADHLWEYSGTITPQSVATALAVVHAAGTLKGEVTYSQIVDLRFVDAAASAGAAAGAAATASGGILGGTTAAPPTAPPVVVPNAG